MGRSRRTELEGEERAFCCCQGMAHKDVRGHQPERGGFGLVVVVVAELPVDGRVGRLIERQSSNRGSAVLQPPTTRDGGREQHGRLLISISINWRRAVQHAAIFPSLSDPLPSSAQIASHIPQYPMSTSNTAPTPSNFEPIFSAALAEYTKKTGKDLRNHPLADKIDGCDSADSILAIFKEQAEAFDKFRKRDDKLFKWLDPIVKVLHAFTTSEVLKDTVSNVSPGTFLNICSVGLNSLSTRYFHHQSMFYLLSGSFYPCVSLHYLCPHLFSH